MLLLAHLSKCLHLTHGCLVHLSFPGRDRLIKQRRIHSALLLQKQKEMRNENIVDEGILAAAVVRRSAKSFEKARLRAAEAA
jgi:hypothetical protein